MTTQRQGTKLTALHTAQARSGEGMDRRIERPRRRPWRWLAAGLGVLLLAVLALWWQQLGGGRSLQVESNRIVVSSVVRGTFEQFIPVRSAVTPLRTVFLDSIEGGRVEQRLVEDGALVEEGQLLAVLSNTSLQLEVARNEALATEQLNNMRTIELELERTRLDHKRNLIEIDYQITRLRRQIERQEGLAAKGLAIQRELEDARDELQYYVNRRAVTLESQAADARLQEAQLVFLRDNTEQIERNLAFARANLEALNVRAPVAGKLSGFDVEVGQSIARGGRLGQVDDPDNYKLRADIDEFYLGRVQLGQRASLEEGGETHYLQVSKIYPRVMNGQFEVDLVFEQAEPAGIRRGQTMQLKLTLGDEFEASLIPNGAYFQDTGGHWIFVVTDDGSEAVRRPVKLGRRNARYIEVLEGLEVGERVVTSPYTSYADMDRLSISASTDQ